MRRVVTLRAAPCPICRYTHLKECGTKPCSNNTVHMLSLSSVTIFMGPTDFLTIPLIRSTRGNVQRLFRQFKGPCATLRNSSISDCCPEPTTDAAISRYAPHASSGRHARPLTGGLRSRDTTRPHASEMDPQEVLLRHRSPRRSCDQRARLD